jgi:hypothetical protein
MFKTKIGCICICACLFFFLLISAECSHTETRDWEYWPESKVKYKVKDNVDLVFFQQFRIKGDFKRWYLYLIYFGPVLKVNKHMDVAFWYKPVFKKTEGHWYGSHRLDADLTLKTDMFGFNLSNRLRGESNLTTGAWVFRERAKIARSIDTPVGKIKPYVQDEIFFTKKSDDKYSSYNENRFCAGIGIKLFFNLDFSAYYMIRSQHVGGGWHYANIFGSCVTLKI